MISPSSNRKHSSSFFDTAPLKELFVFYLPLALTHIMMAGGTPIVNAGIARRPDPVSGLAAFAIAFAFSVFLNSLCFGLEPAAVKLIRGPQSRRRVTVFAVSLGLALSCIQLMVGITPLGHAVFVGFFGVDKPLAEMASQTLICFSPLPFLLSIRSIGRGLLTGVGKTSLVGWGTLLRLLAMIVVTLLGAWGLPVPGPILGALAFGMGILSESLFVWIGAKRHAHKLPGDEAVDVGASYRAITRFVSPILVSGLFAVSIGIVTNAVLTRTQDGEMAVSAFSVVRSVAWFLASIVLAFQQLVIARGNTLEERRHTAHFAALLTVGLTVLLALVSFTSIGVWLMGDLIGLSGAALTAASAALCLTPLIPLTLSTRTYLRGAAIRDHRPGDVLGSSVICLLSAGLSGVLLKDVLAVGATVAVVMWIVANVSETMILLLLRWRTLAAAPELT